MRDIHQVLQQQWQQAYACAQQAVLSEQMENVLWTGQCYERALARMEHAMSIARQYGLPIGAKRLFRYAVCHFHAARVQVAAGWRHEAPPHLVQALQALQQAIALNPYAGHYHAGVGAVLLAQGQVQDAVQAFQRALRCNPLDAWSHWMLAVVSATQGNLLAARKFFTAATHLQPHLPSPWRCMLQHQAVQRSASEMDSLPPQYDWFALIVNGLKLVHNGFTLESGRMDTEPEYVA